MGSHLPAYHQHLQLEVDDILSQAISYIKYANSEMSSFSCRYSGLHAELME